MPGSVASTSPPAFACASRVLVIGAAWILLHLYAGLRLLAHAEMSAGPLALSWSILGMLALAPFGVSFAMRARALPLATAVHWVGFTAIGLSSLLIVLVLAADLLVVRMWGFDARLVSAGILGGAVLLTALGTWRARHPRVVRVTVPIAGLPEDLEGFRIVQISDLHVGATIKRPFVRAVVDAVNELDADVVALTGDVADGRVSALQADVAPLADLRARYGTFFVSGNHDYYWDPARVAPRNRAARVPHTHERSSSDRAWNRTAVAGRGD